MKSKIKIDGRVRITADEISDDTLRLIKARIALQAVKDYRDAYSRKKRTFKKFLKYKMMSQRSPEEQKEYRRLKHIVTDCDNMMQEVEEFAMTSYGEDIFGFDGEHVVNSLRRKVKAEWMDRSLFKRLSED